MLRLVFVLLFSFICSTEAGGFVDKNCSITVSGADEFTAQATACNNVQADSYCRVTYPGGTPSPGPAGSDRAGACFGPSNSTANATALDPAFQSAAIASCPRQCGYCCLTPAYNCLNPVPSPLDCSKITQMQCTDPQWRVQIAKYCPNVCGLCGTNGCVDAVPSCATQSSSICFTSDVLLKAFATTNCAKTCNTCSTTTVGPSPSSSCADTNTNCANWVRNGFCTNAFYTETLRRQYCGRSCNMC